MKPSPEKSSKFSKQDNNSKQRNRAAPEIISEKDLGMIHGGTGDVDFTAGGDAEGKYRRPGFRRPRR
jgi:hypothetical protein